MESVSINDIIQLVGPGPLAVLLIFAWYYLKYLKPKDDARRDADIVARVKENELRRMQIRVLTSFCEHLKKEGVDIDVPDIKQDI